MAFPTSTLTYWTTKHGAAGGEWERDKCLYDNIKDIASVMPCTQNIDITHSSSTTFEPTFGGSDPANCILSPADTSANDTLVSGYDMTALASSGIDFAYTGSGSDGSAYATVVFT